MIAVKVLCVGRNYAKHVRELGGSLPSEPIWFWKPESAIVRDGESVVVPAGVGAVHHEVELAVRIGSVARRVAADSALAHLDACTVAVDVTARDLQNKAKQAGEPWTRAKGFDTFLPLGEWQPLPSDLQAIRLRLSVNGTVRQDGSTSDMLWAVADLVSRASAWTTLHPGDVLLTGTPEGVGPIVSGDDMVAEVVGMARVRNPVVAG